MEQVTKRLSLKKNFSWNFIGNLVYTFAQWAILSLLAKLGNPKMVGQFALGLALTAPIILFTNLQLRSIQATDTENKYQFGEYFGLRIITNVLAILITLFVVFIGQYNVVTSFVIILVAFSKVIESWSDVIFGYLQQKERMDFTAISRIIKAILMLLLPSIFLFITNNVIWMVIGLCLSYVLVFIFYDLKVLKRFTSPKVIFNRKNYIEITKLALPLGIVLMLGSLYINIPRIVIEKYLGEEQLGYFAAIAYLIVAGNTFIGAIGQAAAPRLAILFSEKSFIQFKNLLIKLVSIGFVTGIVGVIITLLFGEFILSIFYDSSYAKYNVVFTLLLISGAFNFSSTFLGIGLTATRSFKIQPYLGVIWIAVSFISAIILIPKFDLFGAGYSAIISAIVQFLSQLIALSVIYLDKLKYSKEKVRS
ncbi:oligosaccharide flippase family protein [Geobacillus thermodenitrificans]|jgi:O-antigen/teichoic acid export membrane protein|uniref:Oligosaccharide flippase family protein n=1 Tax=Geobacillus thermodenitrificans TaxID=33940 RepID=A0ABY9QB33_GEOTD|nr:oligosaccharide flippase family protein [Geobacillus thermodenitrificans]WMV76115.1 oligosaccharide flippase family protein [Geobacillus thermodenitrificans]